MFFTALRAAVSAAALACLAGTALAGPPALVSIGMGGQDITADGLTAVGTIYDASINHYIVYQYTRGAGPFRTGSPFDDGSVHCSSDASAMAWGAYDTENLTGFGTNRSCAHRWSWSDGTVNIGLGPSGNVCDFNVNTANDISGNGNRIVGGMWTNGQCGPFRAWSYDVPSHTWTTLPVSISNPPINAPATATRADSVSNDGSVICGYDQNYNASFTQQIRRAAAWVWNGSAWVEAILDPNGGAAYAVNKSGTAAVGNVSSLTGEVRDVQKWTRSGTTWTRTDLGRTADRGLQSSGGDGPVIRSYPQAVSDDGSTIVGYVEYNDPGNPVSTIRRRPFIWKPSINGGAPIDLQDYILAQGGIGTTFDNMLFTGASALTPDGSAVLMAAYDNRHADCLMSGMNGILYLNGTTCEAPGINFSPVSSYDPGFPGSGYMIFNVFATGSWPLTYQWQKETEPGSDVWVDLADDNCDFNGTMYYDLKGSQGPQLRLGGLSGTWSGRYRCVVTNSCGTAISGVARAATCMADFDCNNYVNGDDADLFGQIFFYGGADCDVNGDGFVNGDDADAFGLAFDAGC